MTDHGVTIPWSVIHSYLETGEPTLIPIVGTPRIEYFVDPYASRTGLRAAVASTTRAPSSPLSAVTTRIVADGSTRLLEIASEEHSLFRDFHELLGGVVERVRLDGQSPIDAFTATVTSWSDLLRRLGRMGLPEQLGLLGELFTLRRFARALGWQAALDAWKGSEHEEHDFGLSSLDLEIKTTSGERRLHTVHGLGQFTATPGRPLWVLSLQFTRSGVGGTSIVTEIEQLRSVLAAEAGPSAEVFERKLKASGWTTDVERHPPEDRWSLRTPPLLLRVDHRMPCLGPESLQALPEGIRSRILEINYRVDLTGLPGEVAVSPELQPLTD
ncbi:PD-(D/E)XK motif protein [Kitasatospora sp. NPDC057223]|uniref:PD-(D/E)XK motif protein n=1 Tax=Kitasatospora sp. NPDC057223 TaxID=3346055 RepID=UPI00363D288A